MDTNGLLTLLTLSEKLQGHPRLSGMKTLVDEQINKMHIESEKEVAKLAVDKKNYQDKIAAEQAAIIQGRTVMQRAVGAHERIDQVEDDKRQVGLDQATIAEADKFAKDQPKTDAEARAIAERAGTAYNPAGPALSPRAIPASPAIEPFAPPEGSSKWVEERNASTEFDQNPVPAPYTPDPPLTPNGRRI